MYVITYAVIADNTELLNMFPTEESAIKYAKSIAYAHDEIKVNKENLNELYGRTFVKTCYKSTKTN